MTSIGSSVHEKEPDPYHDVYAKTVFGFWVYIVTDFMVFATLFATYSVLHNRTFGGPGASELFNLPLALCQTLFFLISSFVIGLAGVAVHKRKRWETILLFFLTFWLGVAFLWLEWFDLERLYIQGNDWEKSAFLSMYFTLVGTHGVHVVFALLWILILLIPVFANGVTAISVQRLTCLRIFWQFLNVVWIFIFSIVYLLGVTYG